MHFKFENMWRITGSLLRVGINGKISVNKFIVDYAKAFSISNNGILRSQPTPESHPHLLKKAEITPGLSSEVYHYRRNKFLNLIRDSRPDSATHLILLPSASVVYMTENIPYPFRQNTDFLYLCGYKEANSVFVISAIADRESESILFVPRPTKLTEQWEGTKMSLKDTTNFLGIDRTLYTDDLENFLQSFAKSSVKFAFWYDFISFHFTLVHQNVRSFMEAYAKYITVDSPRTALHKCRLLKCDYEAELMRKTCRIAAEAIKEVIKISEPFVLESHLHAKMEFECRNKGADCLAFPPVVAGGSRANTIHYIDNNQVVADNEMILIDAGCEYGGYCSDLARTWPVNGRYSEPQRALYNLVLYTQEYLIELCKKKPPLDYLFKVMCNQLGKGLQTLGIISRNLNEEDTAKAAYNYCPHHVSHYLGMDVHDTNNISRGIQLLPQMVITIEPGIYISKDDLNVPEKYRGICVRIEDDVLITENDVEVLTSACPKSADEIEKLIKS